MDGITAQTAFQPATRFGRARATARAHLNRWMAVAAEGVSRAALNRRVVRQLSAMSDRDLRDIGLVRQDVLDSAALLREGDASGFLMGRREERRAARRRPTR